MSEPVHSPGSAAERTSEEKLLAGLSYAGMVILCIPPIIIFFLKKESSPYVAFHALQAIFVWLALFVINMAVSIVGTIPVIGMLAVLASVVLFLAGLAAWVFLMIQGFTGKDFRVPVLADWIEQNLLK